jgi:hypothetical protein
MHPWLERTGLSEPITANTYNGLQGTGYNSWMIKGEQPMQSGN